jgi:hypothetical protein
MKILQKIGLRMRALYFWVKRKLMGELTAAEKIEKHFKLANAMFDLIEQEIKSHSMAHLFSTERIGDGLQIIVGHFKVVLIGMMTNTNNLSAFRTFKHDFHGIEKVKQIPSLLFKCLLFIQ